MRALERLKREFRPTFLSPDKDEIATDKVGVTCDRKGWVRRRYITLWAKPEVIYRMAKWT